MSFISKLVGNSAHKAQAAVSDIARPSFRFGGFEKLGAQTRPADTRSRAELFATIDALAEKNPSVKAFVKDLKGMEPKYLSLAADTIELASRHEMLMTDIDMNKVNQKTGKSLLQYLLGIYPKAAKENPAAMDFAQEVINHTDTLTSKYYLAAFSGSFETPQAAKHLEALKPSVEDIAEATINGGYMGTFEKQKNFISMIRSIITPEAKPEKIALLKDLSRAADRLSGNNEIFIDKFTRSNTPVMQVKENIARLAEGQRDAQIAGKPFDVVDFVNNNVNFAKAKQSEGLSGLRYNA